MRWKRRPKSRDNLDCIGPTRLMQVERQKFAVTKDSCCHHPYANVHLGHRSVNLRDSVG